METKSLAGVSSFKEQLDVLKEQMKMAAPADILAVFLQRNMVPVLQFATENLPGHTSPDRGPGGFFTCRVTEYP
jgi:hypothetical protein